MLQLVGDLLSPVNPHSPTRAAPIKSLLIRFSLSFLSAHEVKEFSLHLVSFNIERQSGLKHTGNLVCLQDNTPKDAYVLIPRISGFYVLAWQRGIKVPDGIKVANQLTLRVSWIVQVAPM